MSIVQRLRDLGITLPPGTPPAANYVNAVRSGYLLYTSGKAPTPIAGRRIRGRLGREFTTADGYSLARSAGLELLAAIQHALGDLERVRRFIEVQGALNTVPEFEDHAQVMDGCSDLLVEVFAERGTHVRSVIGASSLRAGMPLVLKATVEVAGD
jgi:enamine deaminase RidA (YjgF/YER057c/UK114 family)